MKFYSLTGLPERRNDRVFKAPLLSSVVWLILLATVASMSLYAGLHGGKFFVFLIPAGACYGAAVFAVCTGWFAYCSVRARGKPTNWIVRGNDSSLAIKYRSFRNWRMPADDVQIVELAYSEVAWARMVKEWCDTTGLDREKRRALEFYLDLGLVSPETSLLETRLREEMNREWSIVTRDYPVQVLPGGILRIKWRNHGGGAYSSPKDALNWLERHVKTVAPDICRVDLASANSPEALDGRIRQLLQRGEDLAAIAQVRTTYGCSTTEAKAYVDQLRPGKRA